MRRTLSTNQLRAIPPDFIGPLRSLNTLYVSAPTESDAVACNSELEAPCHDAIGRGRTVVCGEDEYTPPTRLFVVRGALRSSSVETQHFSPNELQ